MAAGTNSAILNFNFTAGNYIIALQMTSDKNCIGDIQRTIIIDSVKADFSVLDPVHCGDNLAASFTNLSGSQFGMNTWLWDFGDGATSAQQNPGTHTYPTYGNYDVSLAVESVHGCVDTFRIIPAVVIHPLPAAIIVGDSIHCAPGTYDYTSKMCIRERGNHAPTNTRLLLQIP